MISGSSPATFETPVFKKIESMDTTKVPENDDKEKIDLSKSPGKVNFTLEIIRIL